MNNIKLLFFITLLFGWSKLAHSQDLVLNEIVASNAAVNTDEDGSYEDWIEIYNRGNQIVSLQNYGLSDNSTPFKWVFPNVTLVPGAHLLVWCSDKNRTNPELPLHTNFKISADGETITLTDASGITASQIAATAIPTNQSYGRTSSGNDDFTFFTTPTPGAENAVVVTPETLLPPVFSTLSGFYETSFNLALTHPDPEVTIVYTLDGSTPEVTRISGYTYQYKNQYPEFPGQPFGELIPANLKSLVYLRPFAIANQSSQQNRISSISTTFSEFPHYAPNAPVYKGMVVRARAIKGNVVSETITHNYFIDPEKSSRFSVPIACLTIDEDQFFCYENGILVAGKDFDDWRTANPEAEPLMPNANFERSGDAAEVRGNFSYFDSGIERINQDVGFRVNGGFTRRLPNKSIRIYARSEFGSGNLNYPFFHENYNSYKRLILRNSGNDAYSTYFRDAFIQKTVAHLNLDTQSYQPTITFINGEYNGLLNLRERYDKNYFKRVYNVDDNVLDYLEINGSIVNEGDALHYSQMLDYIANNNLGDPQNYAHATTLLDPVNFTDFFIANIYARNTDWPHNNIEFWRKKTDTYEPDAPYGQDGRWRWVLKDTDFGFGADGGSNAYEHNTLAFASSTGGDEFTNPEWSTFLFRSLLENHDFKNYFISRFADMINTTYQPERLLSIIDQMKAGIEGEILEHGSRWSSIGSMEYWNQNIEVMAEFARQRSPFQRQHLLEKFDLSAEIETTIGVNISDGGYVKINTIDINSNTPGVAQNPYPWQGIYFSGIPIQLKAVANAGFQFSHWSGASNSSSSEITIVRNADFEITAHFVPAYAEIQMPFNYWAIDNTISENQPLTRIASSFEIANEATLEFQSALEGYPFDNNNENWGKSALEIINRPTPVNYIPNANNDISYENAQIRGLQITQPFKHGERENKLLWHVPTNGYYAVKFSFAAKNEQAADQMVLEYAASETTPWSAVGLASNVFELTPDFLLYEADFSSVAAANDNPNFKIRLRFAGSDMETENSGKVIFNNISIFATPVLSALQESQSNYNIFPNPFSEKLFIYGIPNEETQYKIYAVDGKSITGGLLQANEINLSKLQTGVYFLHLITNSQTEIKKLVKK